MILDFLVLRDAVTLLVHLIIPMHILKLFQFVLLIEQLQFPQNLEVVVSSSVLQWIFDLDAIFNQCANALIGEGYFCFSTFGQQNLTEIKALTGQGLDYLDLATIQEKLIAAGYGNGRPCGPAVRAMAVLAAKAWPRSVRPRRSPASTGPRSVPGPLPGRPR